MTRSVATAVAVVKLQHVFLSPIVILAVPPIAVLGQNVFLTVFLALLGLAGMLLGKRSLAVAASASLLVLLIWGKTAASIFNAGSPDTALLVVEFTALLVLMEASSTVLTFAGEISGLEKRRDELSQALRAQLQNWLRTQLVNTSRVALVAIGLSMALLPLAGLTSISTDQLLFSATLALIAVVAILFLVTHRREP